MTIENGAEEATNDIALSEDSETPELVDVVYDGKSYQLPAELKDALLRQADYTRKTQEVAEGRRALEAERAGHRQDAASARSHIQDAARVVALNDQLAHLAQVDWRGLQAQDPAKAQALWQQREEIKNLRDRAVRAWTQREQDHASQAQRATARRADEVHAHLPRLIPGWTPELDAKLAAYGTEQGLSPEDMAQAALHNPHFVRVLHKACRHDELETFTRKRDMTTPNLGMTKPTVGADADNWGTELNANLDLIDARLPKVAFSAYLNNSTQTIPNATSTKVTLNAEEFDVGGYFDSTTNYRFTPQVAGYYQISGRVVFADLTCAAGFSQISIYKNGSRYKLGNQLEVNVSGATTASFGSVVSALVYLNGSTDYVELYVYQFNNAPLNIINGTYNDQNYMTGVLVIAT